MGYAEGNTHGFAMEDMAKEPILIRLLDSGDFDNSNDLIEYLRISGRPSFVAHLVPFIDLEVAAEDYAEIMQALDLFNVSCRIF